MEDLKDYEQQLDDLIEQVQKGIDGLPKLTGQAKQEKMAWLNDRIQRAGTIFKSFKVEMRDLGEAELRVYKDKEQDFNNRITQLINNLNWAKSDADRQDLLTGASGEVHPDNMTTNQLLQKGSQIQDASIEALQRSKGMVNNAQTVAAETTIRLQEQTEQIQAIDQDVDQVESNLKRADKEIRTFMRRAMTDKIILAFLVLILVSLVVIIIYSIAKPDASADPPPDYEVQ